MADIPRVRFKGFTEAWEKRKFGTMFKRRMERNNGQFDNTRWISVAKMYFQEPDKVTSNNIDTRTYVMRRGDIAFEGHSNAEYKYGRFVANDIGDGVISELFPIYMHIDNYDEAYWKYAIQIEEIMAPKLLKCIEISYTSSNKLDEDFFLKEEILVPSLDEQQQIGNFFRSLNHLITLHQHKCDETKELKKYMLQKMFPKNGKKIPEIRFAGFTDNWKKRKFEEIAIRVSTTGTSSKEVPSVEYEDVVSEQGLINKDITQKEIIKVGIRFSSEDVLYGKLRPYLHNWLNPDFKGIAVGDWWVLKPVHSNKNFLYRLIQTPQFDDIANQSSGTKMPRADWKLISNTEFCIPVDLEEQIKIGQYFDNLDHLITLHQRKCDELKEVKKFMLQNMFPQKG